jgi:hypothetical protein
MFSKKKKSKNNLKERRKNARAAKRAERRAGRADRQAERKTRRFVKARGGIMNTVSPVPCKAQYKRAQNETVITGGNSCGYIVLGKDRPDSDASGYGGDGFVGLADEAIDSSRVEIVVGRAASAKDGKGIEPGTFVDNSIPHDAARIYVCETTDVDKNFGLVDGLVGNAIGKSAVAIKADHTRIIGREGIKIVTGKMGNIKAGLKGETNSKGGKLPSAPGIDLIAGNNAEPYTVRGPNLLPETIQRLQPVVVAYNMRDCMSELDGILDDIMAAITTLSFCFVRAQFSVAGALAPLAAVPGAGAVCGVVSSNLVAECHRALAGVTAPIYSSRATKLSWSSNYLQQFSYKFIGSRSVRATY